MNTMTIAAPTVLEHQWVKLPCVCEISGACWSCKIDAAACTVCGLESAGTATTHCPGESLRDQTQSWGLLKSVIRHAGLDFVDGAWEYETEQSIVNARGVKTIWQRAGSIDRLIEYAEHRMRWMAQIRGEVSA